MHRNKLKKFCALGALGISVATAPVATAGLLGERYGSISYDHTIVETAAYDDGGGISLFYNHPILDNIDLGLDYRHTSWDAARAGVGDFTDQRLQIVATGFDQGERDNIFVRVGVGVGKIERGDWDRSNFAWSAAIGTEFTLSESVVFQPYVGWSDMINDNITPRFAYGVLAAVNAGDQISVIARIEGDARYNVTLSLGGLVRF